MQRAMAREAEAERERRAKIINARGELQASQELRQAADVLSPNPASQQPRYLQTLLELGADQNSTVVSPFRSTSWGRSSTAWAARWAPRTAWRRRHGPCPDRLLAVRRYRRGVGGHQRRRD